MKYFKYEERQFTGVAPTLYRPEGFSYGYSPKTIPSYIEPTPLKAAQYQGPVALTEESESDGVSQEEEEGGSTNGVALSTEDLTDFNSSTSKAEGSSSLTSPPPSKQRGPRRQRICKDCRKINFEKLYRDWNQLKNGHSEEPIRVHDVSYLRGVVADCDLCSVLIEMWSFEPDLPWRKPKPRLLFAYRVSDLISESLPNDVPVFAVLEYPMPINWIRELGCKKYLFPVDSLPSSTSGRSIPKTIDRLVIQDWFKFCLFNHREDCNTFEDLNLHNFRVIDCHTRHVVMIEFAEGLEYVTLSYVWGSCIAPPSIELQPPEPLPRTIEDAMLVVKLLGLRYLWVDRYCVPQEDCPEKAMLIQNMGKIYEASSLTIIAAAGQDPSYGLPGIGSTSRVPRPAVCIDARAFAMVDFDVVESAKKSTWNSRAWTYQEALLSRRKLIFTDECVFFQCRAMHCIETISVPLTSLYTNKQRQPHPPSREVNIPRVFPHGKLGEQPLDIVERITEFMRRDITYDRDTLDAFNGIFKAFSKSESPVNHFHGVMLFAPDYFIPELDDLAQRFILGLSWRLQSKTTCRRPSFPSWTWLGWQTTSEDGKYELNLNRHYPDTVDSNTNYQGEETLAEIDIVVEFQDSKCLPLHEAYQKYTQNPTVGFWPTYLHITGTLLDLVFEKREEDSSRRGEKVTSYINKTIPDASRRLHPSERKTWSRNDPDRPRQHPDSNCWTSTMPVLSEIHLPPNQPSLFHTTCLVYSYSTVNMSLLMLIERGNGVYERVGILRLHYDASKSAFASVRARKSIPPISVLERIEMRHDVHLRKETIRLG